jgi:hypothetical protein
VSQVDSTQPILTGTQVVVCGASSTHYKDFPSVTVKSSTLATALALVGTVAIQAIAFNIAAISAANQASRLECWQLAAPPSPGRGAVNFDLGDFNKAFVGILPPNTTTGTISNAVQVQDVLILSSRCSHLNELIVELRILTYIRRYAMVMARLVHITNPHSNLPLLFERGLDLGRSSRMADCSGPQGNCHSKSCHYVPRHRADCHCSVPGCREQTTCA